MAAKRKCARVQDLSQHSLLAEQHQPSSLEDEVENEEFVMAGVNG